MLTAVVVLAIVASLGSAYLGFRVYVLHHQNMNLNSRICDVEDMMNQFINHGFTGELVIH